MEQELEDQFLEVIAALALALQETIKERSDRYTSEHEFDAEGALANAECLLVANPNMSCTTWNREDQIYDAVTTIMRALRRAVAGESVRTVPHCMAAAESLTQGTQFEFRPNYS